MEMILKAAQWMLDAVFPKYCIRCEREGVWLCEPCGEALAPYRGKGCMICKKGTDSMLCADCARQQSVSFLYSAYSYADPFAKKIVHTLKYEYIAGIGESMGQLLAKRMTACVGALSPGVCVVPIPIHTKRLRERGFNQSERIARAYADALGIAYSSGALERIAHTPSQVDLSRDERMQNVIGVFAVRDASAIRGKTVHLLDDVCTTGATLCEAARVLRHAGAQDVIGATFAREE